MTANDLHERLQCGDLDALLDPALPALLRQPDVSWWWPAAVACAGACVDLLAQRAIDEGRATPMAAKVLAWAKALGALDAEARQDAREQVQRLQQLEEARARRRWRIWLQKELLRVEAVFELGPELAGAYLDLVRHLRSLLTEAPPQVEAAVEVLERYSPDSLCG